MGTSKKEELEAGMEVGDKCNRGDCKGVIEETEGDYDGCSCHINPPCSYCVEDRTCCTDCDYTGAE